MTSNVIILTTLDKKIANLIMRFKEDDVLHVAHAHKDLFIDYYGLGTKNNKSMAFVLKDNGIAWCYVCSLLKKYPDAVKVFYSKDLWFQEMPELFKKGGEWLSEKPKRNIQHLPKALDMTKEELEAIKLEDIKKFFVLRKRKI